MLRYILSCISIFILVTTKRDRTNIGKDNLRNDHHLAECLDDEF